MSDWQMVLTFKKKKIMRVNKRLAVIFQTAICALIYAHPSKYRMTQGNFLLQQTIFDCLPHLRPIYFLGGETVFSASFMAHILVLGARWNCLLCGDPVFAL